ncbi:recombinase family protein [Maribacter forsetii]|uniref:recombinase family protein n=1 Tax=Maribacter forsetii TaxID=444515 RepID=UPI0005628D79|nr:recombinase family protein [Maribacter forsetii]
MLAIYSRISREKEEGKDRSIKDQRLRGEALADKLGLNFKHFTDEGVSGTWSLEKRPAFFELIQDLTNKKGLITVVYAFDASRLYRSESTRLSFLSAVRKKNIELYFDNGKFDWSDPYMDFMGKVLSATDVLHVDVTKLKVKSILKRNALEGKAFGITPYGYKTDANGMFIINEEEAEVVKRIYKLSLEGKGTRSIAGILNDEDVPTRYNTIGEGTIVVRNKYTDKKTVKDKKSVNWAGGTVRGIIVNPIYKGIRIWNKHNSKKNRERRKGGRPIDPEIIIELPELQIVTPSYWLKVNNNLKNNVNNKGKNVEHKYMLKGILECSVCGSNYYGRTRLSKKDNYYMCSSKRYKHSTCNNRSINIDVLDSIIWQTMFLDMTLYDDMVKSIAEGDSGKRKKELAKLIDKNKKELSKVVEKRKRMVLAVINGTLEENEVASIRKTISDEENNINEKLNRDEEELLELGNERNLLSELGEDLQLNMLEDSPDAREFYRDKREIWDFIQPTLRSLDFSVSYNEKRRLLNKYIERIFINYDFEKRTFKLELKFKLPIPDRTFIVDFNYIALFDLNQNSLVLWKYENRRYFTEKKISQTLELLRTYQV